VLRQATGEEKEARDRLCHAAWGAQLTLEQFVDRERRLRALPFARSMRTWLWVDGPLVLASCETFRMRSFLDGVEGSSYGLASVFTQAALRGRGHASQMVAQVVKEVRREDPGAHAMLLFSEVGARIYERQGFSARPIAETLLPAQSGDATEGVERLLVVEELPEALARAPRPRDRFLIWPTAAQLEWHLAREEFYARTLGRARPSAWGAAIGRSIALFTAEHKQRQLVVQLLAVERPDHAAPLILAARRVAAAAELATVRLWGDLPLGEARPAADLPMLRPLAPGLQAAEWRTVPHAVWM
jgi:hypothetical protein